MIRRLGRCIAVGLSLALGALPAVGQTAPDPAAETLPDGGGAPPAPPAEPPAPPPAPAPSPATPPAEAPPADEHVHPGLSESLDQSSLKYVLDGIEIRGNTKTRSRVVLRYVPFRAGDVIDVEDQKIELTRYRLLGTGFFRDVQLSLRKGAHRGHVVLVVEVIERNTLIVNDLWMGLSADADTGGRARPLTAYAGVDAAETNLAGSGITLGGAVAIAREQLAFRARFFDPAFLGGHWMTTGSVLYNDAVDFFGNRAVYFDDTTTLSGQRQGFAVVQYQRFGGALGFGRDLSVSTQLWGQYRLERIGADVPTVASHIRGTRGELDREPIDFHILRGLSVLSTISATLQHDTRDRPFLPTRGWFTSVTTEVSLSPLGSEYPYSRIDLLASKWWTLPWKHVLKLRLFGGAISGRAPFFERYYTGDLSDFRAPRVLGLNVERRPAPNFFGTDIEEIRTGDYAGKADVEYRIPLYHGTRSVFGIDLFARAGLFAIADRRDITHPPGGYSGAALVPIDFTANLGVLVDTSAGGFSFALGSIVGFLPALSEDR